jgi:hypothetical protein
MKRTFQKIKKYILKRKLFMNIPPNNTMQVFLCDTCIVSFSRCSVSKIKLKKCVYYIKKGERK